MANGNVADLDRSAGLRFYRFAFWFLVAIGLVAAIGAVVSMMYSGIGWDASMDTGQSVVIREVVPNLSAGSTLAAAYEKIFLQLSFMGF